MSNIITPAKPKSVTINGSDYELIAFYYPGHDTAWDKIYHGQFLTNFYLCKIDMDHKGIKASFHTTEAAFQATKWWSDDTIRHQFEAAKTGDDAFQIKKKLHGADTDYPGHVGYAGYGRNGSMKAILTEKFKDPNLAAALLATNGAYLLEHNSHVGRDTHWSDNKDGTGGNQLGITLMEVRKDLGGSGVPTGTYSVSDFTKQVM